MECGVTTAASRSVLPSHFKGLEQTGFWPPALVETFVETFVAAFIDALPFDKGLDKECDQGFQRNWLRVFQSRVFRPSGTDTMRQEEYNTFCLATGLVADLIGAWLRWNKLKTLHESRPHEI